MSSHLLLTFAAALVECMLQPLVASLAYPAYLGKLTHSAATFRQQGTNSSLNHTYNMLGYLLSCLMSLLRENAPDSGCSFFETALDTR
jgi:hypothetical protein